MLNWFSKLFEIVANYDRDIEGSNKKADAARGLSQLAKKQADEAVSIIRDRSRDYVEIVALSPTDFDDTVDRIKYEQRYGTARRMDVVPSMRFVIDRELGR